MAPKMERNAQSFFTGMLATQAAMDGTKPIDASGAGWTTNHLLGTYELIIMRTHQDYAGFAVVCSHALKMIERDNSVDPAVKTLLALGQFNGERRQTPVTEPLKGEIFAKAASLKAQIDSLPEGTRKDRCKAFFKYQFATFVKASGAFDKAAELQLEAAEVATAAGDKPGAGIANFLTLVNLAQHAMVGNDFIDEAVNAVIDHLPTLQDAVQGTTVELPWGTGNPLSHCLLLLAWAKRDGEREWRDLYQQLCAKRSVLSADFSESLSLFEAINSRDPSKLEKLNQDGSIEVVETTKLFRARWADNQQSAKALYDSISNDPSVCHIRAIADREAQLLGV